MDPGLARLHELKKRGEKIAVLTCYDYATARVLDEAGLDLLLVGDSLGMVVLGYPDTTLVTMDEMVHHTRAVARGAMKTPILADLPIDTFGSPRHALLNSRWLLDAGAAAVKLEGGATHTAQIAALAEAHVPVMAHIGMMPQRVREEGGYHRKGRTPEEADALLADALAVEQAGAFAVLLELVDPAVAELISRTVSIPTIGIGSGPACDGQVLVIHDVLGAFPWFTPKFVKPRAAVAQTIDEAARGFVAEVKGVA